MATECAFDSTALRAWFAIVGAFSQSLSLSQ
jgi:hypothetical protein